MLGSTRVKGCFCAMDQGLVLRFVLQGVCRVQSLFSQRCIDSWLICKTV